MNLLQTLRWIVTWGKENKEKLKIWRMSFSVLFILEIPGFQRCQEVAVEITFFFETWPKLLLCPDPTEAFLSRLTFRLGWDCSHGGSDQNVNTAWSVDIPWSMFWTPHRSDMRAFFSYIYQYIYQLCHEISAKRQDGRDEGRRKGRLSRRQKRRFSIHGSSLQEQWQSLETQLKKNMAQKHGKRNH